MASTVIRAVRDRLVDDATMRGLLSVTTTGSAPVTPVFMERTGVYPQIVYSESWGRTDPGMSATNGFIAFDIEVQATGGVNPHITQNNIAERIDQLFDDQVITGVGISGTSLYAPHFLREGGTEIVYNEERKIYQKFINYSYRILNY